MQDKKSEGFFVYFFLSKDICFHEMETGEFHEGLCEQKALFRDNLEDALNLNTTPRNTSRVIYTRGGRGGQIRRVVMGFWD